jgi:hypothetical protein
MIVWLITSGYTIFTSLPDNARKDVQCTLNVDWEMGVVRINCDRVVHNKSSSAEYVTAHDSETAFFFNLNIYKKHPALFYSAIQDSIVNLRSDLRKNSVKEKMNAGKEN